MADTTPKAQVLTAEELERADELWLVPLGNETPAERSTRYFVRRLLHTVYAWRNALHSLTPGGSEYQTPEACVAIVRETRRTQHNVAATAIMERKAAEATLSASRAETEAVRAERDRTSNNRDMWRGQCERQATDLVAARSLAAELVEGLAQIERALRKDSRDKSIGAETVEYHLDGQAMYQAINGARALLSKARAAGIPEDRTPRVCPKCKTLVRGDDRHACAPEGSPDDPLTFNGADGVRSVARVVADPGYHDLPAPEGEKGEG